MISTSKTRAHLVQRAHTLLHAGYIMKNLLIVALSLPLVACVVGSDGQSPPGDDDGSGSGSGSGSDPNGISGHITADQTWTGTVAVVGATTIDPNVTVTVTAGTTVNFAGTASLAIKGTFDVQGTSASKVILHPETGSFFGGLTVGGMPEMSGALKLAYAEQTGGAIVTQVGGTATITDTKMFGAGGDFLIMNGGTVDVSFSQLGADLGGTDTTHCNMHFGGSGNIISVTHSNINGTPYGLMFYGGQNAIFTNNNWEKTTNGSADWIDSQPGVSGDFSGGYFSAGPPVAKAGATFTVNTPATAPLADAGIRP